MNIRPRFYLSSKFNNIFYRWLLAIVNFARWNFPHVLDRVRIDTGHGNNSTTKSWTHFFIAAAVRTAALSRWKILFSISISITRNYNSPCNVRYSIAFDLSFTIGISLNTFKYDQWFLASIKEIIYNNI